MARNPILYSSHTSAEEDLNRLDDEIAVIRGSIWDNCRDYCRKCRIYIEENCEKRVVKRCPGCGRAMGFIPKDGIDEYLKILPTDEREAREEGKWLHLSGLVYKTFDQSIHVYEDFMPPKSWMKVEGVDPHDARATNWIFGMISPEEIEIFDKTRNRFYCYDYLLLDGSIDDMVRKVKSLRNFYGYEEPFAVMLDRKYGTQSQMVTAESPEKRTWQSEFEKAGINRIKLSHSSPGDVELGHKVVKEYLKPQYSTLHQATRPGLMFAKDGCGGASGPIKYMQSYQYDEKTQKADDKYKDWPDVIRYIAMEQFVYRSPESESRKNEMLKERMAAAMMKRRSLESGVGR